MTRETLPEVVADRDLPTLLQADLEAAKKRAKEIPALSSSTIRRETEEGARPD